MMLPRQAVTSIGDTAFRRAGLTDICYGGTEDQWKTIKIGQYNESLNKANIHYNSPIQEQPGTTTTPAAGRFTDELHRGGISMYSFTNDYSEGAHPRILKAMMETNLTQNTGYSQATAWTATAIMPEN
jgi:hypothetical protein